MPCARGRAGPDRGDAALAAQRPLFELVDWYLCGSAEARLLLGVEEQDVPEAMASAGIARAVLRVGGRGSLVLTPNSVVEVAHERCARAGHAIAVHALCGTGDWETLPRLNELSEELGVAAERRVP